MKKLLLSFCVIFLFTSIGVSQTRRYNVLIEMIDYAKTGGKLEKELASRLSGLGDVDVVTTGPADFALVVATEPVLVNRRNIGLAVRFDMITAKPCNDGQATVTLAKGLFVGETKDIPKLAGGIVNDINTLVFTPLKTGVRPK